MKSQVSSNKFDSKIVTTEKEATKLAILVVNVNH